MNDPQRDMAAGLYQLEQLRAKLIVGRLLGIAAGAALWWFVLGPLFEGNFAATFIAAIACLVGGLWIGQMVTLRVLR